MIILLAWLVFNLVSIIPDWVVEQHTGYKIAYTRIDEENRENYVLLIDNGIESVKAFFGKPFEHEFQIFVYPDRRSLDTAWQKEWKMPDFKSECWMVASGIASKLDMISPKAWDKEACEHRYADTTKTQQLITHELVHVYHGQINASPEFSDVMGIDWFVEGLATYASGQCDSSRLSEVKKAIVSENVPEKLDDFWTGKIKYGLSGSMVMYIDHTYGRTTINQLLKYNRK